MARVVYPAAPTGTPILPATTIIMPVRHDAAAHKFLAPTDGADAYLAYEPTEDGTLDLQHTIVPADARGAGVGASLVEAAVAYARAEHVKLIPSCAFADAWFGEHPEANDVLAGPRSDAAI